jgi:hypothetical protein
VRAAVERSGAKGSFWSDHPDVPKVPIADWQIWNEPNFSLFWKPAPDARRYLELLRVFHDPRERPKDGELHVAALPAGSGDPLRRGGAPPLRRDPGRRPPFGGGAPRPDALFGDAGKPIWITEAGWASGGTASALTVDPERLGIVGVVWYSLRDMPGALLARPLRTVSSWTEGRSSPGRR